MLIDQRGYRLNFENDFIVAHEIRGKCLDKRPRTILQGLRGFREKWNALEFELNFQTLVIYRFEEAAAFILVDSKAGADDCVAFRFVNQFSTFLF